MGTKRREEEVEPGRSGVMRIEAEINVYDTDGKREYTQKCKTWVKQFLQLLKGRICEADEANIKDTGGTDRTLPATITGMCRDVYVGIYGTQAGAGSTTYGIILGTGTTAVTYADYVIETLIAHGTGAGQLSYAAMGKTAISDITGGQQFAVTRVITNSSGGSITVNEIALYGRAIYMVDAAVGYYYYFCIERTVLGTPITIADGDTKTFEYRIKLTV